MARYSAVVISIVLSVFLTSSTAAYEVVEVKDGATVKGTVRFEGAVPPEETILITEDVKVCDKGQKTGIYLVSDSKVKNTVVWLEGIMKGKANYEEPVVIAISDCRVEPHVSTGIVGGEFLFRNDDDILHTIQLKLGLAYQKQVSGRPLKDGATIYNLALPKKGQEIRKPIKKWHRYAEDKGFIQIRSNTHNWIRGFIYIFDHPYAAVTDEKGSFAIAGIPPGDYLLRAWHEGLGRIKEREVKVRSGETLNVELDFDN